MNFYSSTHAHYCGIDLHARSLYVCIISQAGEVVLHKEVSANPTALLSLLEPYRADLVVGVECMHCWYWLADCCEDNGIAFILGHALYMRAIHGGKTKNDRIDSYKIACLMRGGNFPLAYTYPRAMRGTRDLLRRRTRLVRHGADLKAHVVNTTSQYNLPPSRVNLKNVSAREALRHTFDQPEVQRNIDLDMAVLECYHRELSQLEWFIEQQAKSHRPVRSTPLELDTPLSTLAQLVFQRADVTQRTMTSGAVVINFNVLENRLAHVGPIPDGLILHRFHFKRVEKALGNGIDAPMSITWSNPT